MAEIHPMEHKLTEAVEGQRAATPLGADPGSGPGNGPDPALIAEETRRAQEARDDGHPDRKDRLVDIGRGEQTAGRHAYKDRS